ncbi:MAG: DUF2919 family protein [Pseudomonadales bacterium]|nr:DUF2919 family protein [Pseudomonadales bacterium]MBO7004643.1 DUF2919 family protein [Pseudomonadales bacterium]
MKTLHIFPMFAIDDYDNAGIIKPGFFLIICTAFTARFILTWPLYMLAKRGLRAKEKGALDFLTNVSPLEMMSSIPALVILLLIISRDVDSPNWMRIIWARGRELLVISVALQLGILVIGNSSIKSLQITDTVIGAISLFLVFYFSLNPRPKAVFSMFPTKPVEDAKN